MVYVTVIESFALTWGILASLENVTNGLVPGTVLRSEDTDLTWEVVYRQLYFHVMDKQRRFPGERTEYMRFGSIGKHDNIIEHAKRTLENEDKAIFDYILKAIDHADKPVKGSRLIVV